MSPDRQVPPPPPPRQGLHPGATVPAVPSPPPPPAASAEAGSAPVAASLPARVSGLSCPGCGGALEVDAGVRVVHCPFCSTPLLATSELGLRRFAVEPRVSLEQAREAVGRWWGKGWNKDPRLVKEARMQEGYLCFLPFFRVQADVVGVALGTEERERTTGSGKNRRTTTYEVDVERWVEKSCDHTYAAVNVAELGVDRVSLQGDHLLPFDSDGLARRGMVFPPTRSEAEVRAAALEELKRTADPASGLKRVRFHFLETVRERLTVVYYPLWVSRYRFEKRSYVTVVDAEDGSLAYGKAPGNDFYRALIMVLTLAAVCWVGTTAIQMARDFELIIGAFVFGAAALAWGWKTFRYGGVVEEGSGRRRTDPTLAQRLQRLDDAGSPTAALGVLVGSGGRRGGRRR